MGICEILKPSSLFPLFHCVQKGLNNLCTCWSTFAFLIIYLAKVNHEMASAMTLSQEKKYQSSQKFAIKQEGFCVFCCNFFYTIISVQNKSKEEKTEKQIAPSVSHMVPQ